MADITKHSRPDAPKKKERWGQLSFVCHYCQWPILIKYVKYYCLCPLVWLMRPVLALNCMLQVEQERKFCWWCLSSGFPLCAFLFSFADCFCFVFTSIPTYEASPLCSILYNLYPRFSWYVSLGMLVLREALKITCIASSDHHRGVFRLVPFL